MNKKTMSNSFLALGFLWIIGFGLIYKSPVLLPIGIIFLIIGISERFYKRKK